MADNTKIMYSIIWLIFLFVVGWPIAYMCAGAWIFLLPLEAFGIIQAPVKSINDFLEKLITWPREIGTAIVEGTSEFPRPF
mmetsp:Transcript_26532/g.37269  ORF Transcript_26532/g.37269 Transcript_26532/m.37269 type:complete len:81 (+) Transcript_26532:213-455(+)